MRRIALILAAPVAVFALQASPRPVSAQPTVAPAVHPYFDDKGTLAWYCDLTAAQAAGRASGKLLFIEYGRRACCNCRTLVSRVLPAPAVKSRMAASCIGLAADCDEPDPRVEAVFRRSMPDASLLPFVAVVSPDLEYVTGWQGAIEVPGCCAELGKIEAWRETTARRDAAAAKAAKAAAEASRPKAPCGQPAAAPAPTIASAARPAANVPPSIATGSTVGGPPAIGNEAAALAAARELLRQAESASGAGKHADVVRLDREAAGLSLRVEPTRWATILAAADRWADGLLAEAAKAAVAGKTSDAESSIETVRRDAAGRSASIDAERGSRALTMRSVIASSPAATREQATRDARNSFRGTRWAALFTP
jgi:hypothetical protein